MTLTSTAHVFTETKAEIELHTEVRSGSYRTIDYLDIGDLTLIFRDITFFGFLEFLTSLKSKESNLSYNDIKNKDKKPLGEHSVDYIAPQFIETLSDEIKDESI